MQDNHSVGQGDPSFLMRDVLPSGSPRDKVHPMGFKFTVGQTVAYKPPNSAISLCTIVKQIPKEDDQPDFRYRIKSQQGSFVRNVSEHDLAASDQPENLYDFVARLHRVKHH
jgi:hypothetical protein